MVTRIVGDLVSRSHTAFSASYVFLMFAWYLAAAGYLRNPSIAMALSLVAASVMGPAVTMAAVAPREVHLLPVTRRHLWLATCVTAMCVPALVLAAAHATGLALAMLGTRPVRLQPSSMTLTAVAVFAWCGATVALLPLVRGVSARLGEGRAATVLVGLLAVTGFAIGPFLPLLAIRTLPVEWSLVTPGWALLLVVCLAAAVFALLHQPPVVPRERPASPASPATRAVTCSIWSLGDRLTGRARLLVQTAWQSGLAWGGGVAGMAVAVVLFERFVFRSENVLMSLQEFGLLPFATTDARLSLPIGFLFVLALTRSGSALRPSLRATVRQLRVLPMPVSEAASWVLGRAAIDWVAIWVALLMLQLVVAGFPETLLLQWLFLLAGLDALICALQLRWARSGGIVGAGVFVTIGVVALLVRAMGPLAPWLIGAVGLGLIGVAWRLVAGALRYSRVPYRIDPPKDVPVPFGIRG